MVTRTIITAKVKAEVFEITDQGINSRERGK